MISIHEAPVSVDGSAVTGPEIPFGMSLRLREVEVWEKVLGFEIDIPQPPGYLEGVDVDKFFAQGYDIVFIPDLSPEKNSLGIPDREAFDKKYPGLVDLTHEGNDLFWQLLVSGSESNLSGRYSVVQRHPVCLGGQIDSPKQIAELAQTVNTNSRDSLFDELKIAHLKESLPFNTLNPIDIALLSLRGYDFSGFEVSGNSGATIVFDEEGKMLLKEAKGFLPFDATTRLAFVLPNASSGKGIALNYGNTFRALTFVTEQIQGRHLSISQEVLEAVYKDLKTKCKGLTGTSGIELGLGPSFIQSSWDIDPVKGTATLVWLSKKWNTEIRRGEIRREIDGGGKPTNWKHHFSSSSQGHENYEGDDGN